MDIGNTTIALGLFDGENLAATWRISADTRRTTDEYAALLQSLLALPFHRRGPGVPTAAVLAGVVPALEPIFQQAVGRFLGLDTLTINHSCRLGLRVVVDNPDQVGIDRILGASAAYNLFGGPLIVVDFGTATTFNAVSAGGEFLGGAIAPGLATALEALVSRTAKLPPVPLARPSRAIGRDTISSMQAGLVYGYLGLVEGLIRRFWEEMGECRVVATGGLGQMMAAECPLITAADPNLTLKGLRIAYELNRFAGKC